MTDYIEGIPLYDWTKQNTPKSELVFANGFWHQIDFVRATLVYLFFANASQYKDEPVRVVGTHTSKSVLLPVYSMYVPGVVEVRLRHNFFNWVVSVASRWPVPDNFFDLFDRHAQQKLVLSEGFDANWVFPPYANNKKQFSLTLYNQFELYTFCFLLSASLGLRMDDIVPAPRQR